MADPIPLPDLIAKCEQAVALLREVEDAIDVIDDGYRRGILFTRLEDARHNAAVVGGLLPQWMPANEPEAVPS